MHMSDSLHVPVVDLGQGHRRFVWDLPYGQVLIDVFADGRVAVNGEPIGPTGTQPDRLPVEPAAAEPAATTGQSQGGSARPDDESTMIRT